MQEGARLITYAHATANPKLVAPLTPLSLSLCIVLWWCRMVQGYERGPACLNLDLCTTHHPVTYLHVIAIDWTVLAI